MGRFWPTRRQLTVGQNSNPACRTHDEIRFRARSDVHGNQRTFLPFCGYGDGI